MVEKYNKLVRDRIPEIIRKRGDIPKIEILDDESYLIALNRKLKEEVTEYFEDYSVSELADTVEVIYALVKYKGLSIADFEQIRQKKVDERGGFSDKIALIEVERKHN